jgi:glycosyltransferase involved in cell wall biosynthesis
MNLGDAKSLGAEQPGRSTEPREEPASLYLSVVVPALNERQALPALIEEITSVCATLDGDWELIVIDDGSSDGSIELVGQIAARNPRVLGVRLRRTFGKSAALSTGFARSAGAFIVTLDGDGQDDPADIPRLIAELDSGHDLVSGWKRERRDPLSRRLASRVFNGITSKLSGQRLHDMNSGFKAYRAECAHSLQIYGELHRFIPVLAAQQGWRVTEVPVNHRPRQFGRSRFGSERYLRGALDLLTVTFLGRYQHRPLHLFGGVGIMVTLVGIAISIYLTALKLSGEAIGQRPLLFLGVLLIVVGVQLLSLGLLGQMLAALARTERSSPPRPETYIERTVGLKDQGPPAPGDSSPAATETTHPARAAPPGVPETSAGSRRSSD